MRLSNAAFCVRGQKKQLLRKFVPETRLKNSWLSQSIIRFSFYSHEFLETYTTWMLLWLPFQERSFVLNKSLINQILQKSLQNKRNFVSSTHTCHQTCLYIFWEFFCSKNSIKKQLVLPKCHTFFIVFTRIARNKFNLNVTLTTISGERLCTK